MIAARFLRNVIAAVPSTIHWAPPDDGIQFTDRACDASAFHPIVDRICDEIGIERRPATVTHPRTNGRVERRNRTIEEAAVGRVHRRRSRPARTPARRRPLADVLSAYDVGRRPKALKGLAPDAFVRQRFTAEPERFRLDPIRQMPGPNI
jgi:hypothetical protein